MPVAPRADPALAADLLQCPRDAAPLEPFVIGEVTVDTCSRCSGKWLDAGELRQVTHDPEIESLALRADRTAVATMACPRCGGTCYPSSVEDVALDTCVACGGIWLDAGELAEARKRVAIRRAAAQPSPLRRLLDRL